MRLPESRAAQAEMAREYGVEGFCYYHYWFAGRRLLERPVNEIIASGEPDFPFCLCWANQTWSGIWHGRPNDVLIEQTYPGEDDHRRHFDFLLSAFSDKRYLTVHGKPILVIYRPSDIPNVQKVMDFWRGLAEKSGLKGLHLVGVRFGDDPWKPEEHGFDACLAQQLPYLRPWISRRRPIRWLKNQYQIRFNLPTVYDYEEVMDGFLCFDDPPERYYQCVVPNWDNSPRSGSNGLVLHGSTPDLFRKHLSRAVELATRARGDDAIIFVKSWNEWAEGNHLEPDLKFGRAYLEVLKELVVADVSRR